MSHTEERGQWSLFRTLKKESSTSTSLTVCQVPPQVALSLIKSKMNGNSASLPTGELVSKPPTIYSFTHVFLGWQAPLSQGWLPSHTATGTAILAIFKCLKIVKL